MVRLTKKKGGKIDETNIFIHIKSIGFEIETTDLIKFTVEKGLKKDILVNSALTNIDIEYGYIDENEYTNLIDTSDVKFKITNDSAEDSEFNEKLEIIMNKHKRNGICKKNILKLRLPKNDYLTQKEYSIKIREPDTKLYNCSSFTDVEWISTFYKPNLSKNVILNYFFSTIKYLKEHLHP